MKKIILFFFFISTLPAFSQSVIPTKGKDFWVAFPYAPGSISFSPGSKRCDVFITSEVNTTGVISIPQQGWTQSFSVTANQTTTINIPVNLVEHLTSEVVENKGVEITSVDTVSVFSISFQDVSADGTVVYPKQSLGTTYRTCGYKGINGGAAPDYNSEILIVATEDATQVIITPSVATFGGHAAGVPFTVNLNAGQSYQVLAATFDIDLTGTVIEATDSSGSCRPFAVFSGSTCVNIPAGCYACDVLYEQAIPVLNWGKTFFAAPFSFATEYTLRILADQNNTSFTIDGGPATILNAGQYVEINNIYGTQCINANKPICAAQYMEGNSCSSAGDPSMMYLNAEDQKIDRVTFSTVTSTVITQHNVNVFMSTSQINQLTLDGVAVPSSSFSPMTFCSNISYAQLSLTQGSHTLAADSGFTAYAYGTGSYESYAYSVGSFSKTSPIRIDSFLCSSDTMQLGTLNTIFGAWWSTLTDPTDTIAIGPVLTLTAPILPDKYIEHGTEFISGCDVAYYYNVETPDTPQTSIVAAASIACQNQKVQLTAGVIPASSIYQYTWSPTTGLNNPYIANPIATATTSMWYHVTMSTPTGCNPTLYDSIYINVLSIPLPVVNGGSNQSICSGTSAILSASGGVSYLWVPSGDTTNSITVSPSTTTNYIVFVTDTNGCGNSDTVKVSVQQSPIGNAGVDQSICKGNTTVLNASGGNSYLWTNNGATASTIIVFPDSTTDFIVQVSDLTGCFDRDTVRVNVNSLPVANAGPDQITCNASPLTLTASGGTSYLWTPGNLTTNSIQITPSSTIDYIVKVTDGNGCENFDTVRVTVLPFISGTISNQSICQGEIITLIDSGGVSYLWTPVGITDSSITVSPQISTDFVVHIITSNGCQVNDTVHVNVISLPPANAGADVTICIGSQVILNATGGVSYLWLSNFSSDSSLIVSPVSSQEYVVRVTDNNGCMKNDSVYITVNALPVAYAGTDVFICPGYSVSLNATGGTSYLWDPGGSISPSILVSPAVSTNYKVEVTDVNGCRNTDTVSIYLYPNPNAAFGVTSTVCENYPVTLMNYSSVSSGTILSNNWNFGDGNTASILDPIHTYLGFGSYNIKLVTTSDNGCIDSTNNTITVNPIPTVNFATEVKCALEPSQFTDLSSVGTGGINKWYWEFGDGEIDISQNPAHVYLHEGTYNVSLKVTSDSGCFNSLQKLQAVRIYPLPIANFSFNPDAISILDPRVEFTDASSGGLIWNWNFGDGNYNSGLQNPSHTYSDTGIYDVQLILTNNFNCYDTAYRRIYVEPFFAVYFPNAFTPNGDSNNDFFSPYGVGINEMEIFIYDRWGNEIFRSTGTSVLWNGNDGTRIQNCQEGVYVYLAKITDYKWIKHEFTGSVTLIR